MMESMNLKSMEKMENIKSLIVIFYYLYIHFNNLILKHLKIH
jgi:hypothetical protein